MGRWSYELDGSDDAADYCNDIMHTLCQVIGISYSDDLFDRETGTFTPEELEKINGVIDTLEFPTGDEYQDLASKNALICLCLMEHGINIPENIKEDTNSDLEELIQMERFPEEVDHAKALEKELSEYKNSPVYVGGQGLMGAIADHISQGKPGLLNKEPIDKQNPK